MSLERELDAVFALEGVLGGRDAMTMIPRLSF